MMKRATLTSLNAWMRKEFPDLDAEMFKGAGYFYFSGRDEVPSIYVYALSHMSFDEWTQHIRSSVKDSQTYRYSR